MNSERRVVITGLGVITPVGNDLETFWKSLVEGKSGIGRIQTFDTANYDCKIGGEVRDFDPKNFSKTPKTSGAQIVSFNWPWLPPRCRSRIAASTWRRSIAIASA